MDENTHRNLSDPGAVPGASTQVSPDSDSEIRKGTELSSVEIAKVLPADAPEAPRDTGGEAVAGGAPESAARYCAECLRYGDLTALDYRLPDGSLCEFHAARKQRERDAAEVPDGCQCCHVGYPCECCELHWSPVERAARDLAHLVLQRLERRGGGL